VGLVKFIIGWIPDNRPPQTKYGKETSQFKTPSGQEEESDDTATAFWPLAAQVLVKLKSRDSASKQQAATRNSRVALAQKTASACVLYIYISK